MVAPISYAYSSPAPAISTAAASDFTCINRTKADFQTIVLSLTVPLVAGKRSLDFEIRGIGNAFIIRNITISQAGATLKFYDSNNRLNEYVSLT